MEAMVANLSKTPSDKPTPCKLFDEEENGSNGSLRYLLLVTGNLTRRLCLSSMKDPRPNFVIRITSEFSTNWVDWKTQTPGQHDPRGWDSES